MYRVYYKYQFDPANQADFETENLANEFAKRCRIKGWDATVVRK